MSDRITLSYEYNKHLCLRLIFEIVFFFSQRAHQQDKQEWQDSSFSYIHIESMDILSVHCIFLSLNVVHYTILVHLGNR